MKTRFLASRLIAVLLSMALISVASAQNTASSARGTISDASGAPIANASVIITHVQSGSTKVATTGDSGNYFRSGLRVGGPYTFTVSAAGYRGTEIEEVYFSQGTQAPINVALEPAGETVEEIVVTSAPAPTRDLNNGVGTGVTAQDIANTPAGARDIIQTLMREPLAQSDGEGRLTVAGTNPRFNGLAIDGAMQQDDFGLGSNTYATARSPINLDAVESASLVASDYDVAAAGFTGGLVNITTKSGTNEWDGSAFYYFQKPENYGEKYGSGNNSGTFDPTGIDDKEFGLSIGGPIIKDKLFIFASYDEFEGTRSSNFASADEDNGVLPGFYTALHDIIQTSTGYDVGLRPDSANVAATSERTLAKLDWNITDQHRASFTYQKTEEGGTSVDDLSYVTAWYDIPVDLEATSLQLFSDWNDSLSTTLRINEKEFTRGQLCKAGPGVGQIEIDNINIADLVGTPAEGLLTQDDLDNVIGGCDRFRHANEFDDERTTFFARADFIAGDHVISGGFELEDFSMFNLFISDSRGRFNYTSFPNLVAGTASVSYQNDITNIADNAAASWGYDKWSYFIQDTWQVTPTFELGFGIRYETFDQSDKPAFDQSILDTYGVDSSHNLDGIDLVMPRINFRWDVSDRTSLTGGFGLFAGGDPKVWTSNSFQLPVSRGTGTILNADPTTVPQSLLDQVALGTPVPIDTIAPNFETPSDWKASLRLEQDFDIGSSQDYTFTAQYLYTQVKDGFMWTNLAQTSRADTTPGVAPDGRPIYADLNVLGISNVTELSNFSDGENHVITLALAKRYDYGLDLVLSYAHQDIEAVTEGTSSRGVSNWRGIISSDRNDPGVRPSPFEIEHSIKLHVGLEKDFFGSGNATTRFDLSFQRLSGDKYAHTFNTSSSNPLFGRASFESPFDTDALYVPTSASDSAVVYGAGFDQSAFDAYVKKRVKGKGIITPFTSSSSWNSVMNVRIQQSIPGFKFFGNSLGDNNFRVVLNIDNLLNMLNEDWGVWNDGPGFLDNDIVTADLVTVADVAANGVAGATALTGDSPRTNCLSQSDCVYRFNSFNGRSVDFDSSFKSVYKVKLGIAFDF